MWRVNGSSVNFIKQEPNTTSRARSPRINSSSRDIMRVDPLERKGFCNRERLLTIFFAFHCSVSTPLDTSQAV